MGLEKRYLVLEGILTSSLIMAVGVSFAAVGIALVSVLCVHPVLVWATKDDPEAIEFFSRSLFHSKHYPPHKRLDEKDTFFGLGLPRSNYIRKDSLW